MISPEAALVVCRFLFDGAAMFLWGSAAYLAAFVSRPFRTEIEVSVRKPQLVAAAIAVVATAAVLPLRTAIIGDGWTDAINTGTLASVLLESNVGTAWMAQAGAVLVSVLAVMTRSRRQVEIAVASGALLATLCLTGHAGMNRGWLARVHAVNDAIHVLSAGFWFGALYPVLLALRAMNEPGFGKDARQALARFSSIGHFAVAATIATGLANVYLVVGHLPYEWSILYQFLLSVKIILVGMMVTIAIGNRYVAVPGIARHWPGALVALKLGTRSEIAIGIAVFALVSWVGTLDPM